MAREKIRVLRKTRNLSQAALGRLTNLTTAEISRIELGYRDVSEAEISALATALAVDLAEISDRPPVVAVAEMGKGLAVAAVVPVQKATQAPEAPNPVVEKPAPVGSDLADPANFGLLPDLELLRPSSVNEAAFRSRLSSEIARAQKILHTSKIPAAVWRAWREFEKRATERLQAPTRPPEAVSVPLVPVTVSPIATLPAKVEARSFNALFVEAVRKFAPPNVVEQLTRDAENSKRTDPTAGFMKHFRAHAEKELPIAILDQARKLAEIQASSPERARARRGRR